jgi:hypothetical protein
VNHRIAKYSFSSVAATMTAFLVQLSGIYLQLIILLKGKISFTSGLMDAATQITPCYFLGTVSRDCHRRLGSRTLRRDRSHEVNLFLSLFSTPAQRNDLPVASDRFDRRPTTLVRSRPLRRNIFGASNFEELPQVLIQSSKLFHSLFDQIRVNWIGRIVWNLRQSPVTGLVWLFTDEGALALVDVLPAKDLRGR